MDPRTNQEGEHGTQDHPRSDGNSSHAQTAPSEEFEETFEELKFPEMAFQDKWTLWEQYETKYSSDYKNTMQKVACFNDPVSFWKVWNTVPHSDPLNFIHYYEEENAESAVAKHYVVRGQEHKISAVSLFKTGIIPAWEDPVNAKGGEFSAKLHCTKEEIKPIWEEIILEIISSSFPNSDQVCGIRMLDKAQMFKVEVWVKYEKQNDQEAFGAQFHRLKELMQGLNPKIEYFSHKKM